MANFLFLGILTQWRQVNVSSCCFISNVLLPSRSCRDSPKAHRTERQSWGWNTIGTTEHQRLLCAGSCHTTHPLHSWNSVQNQVHAHFNKAINFNGIPQSQNCQLRFLRTQDVLLWTPFAVAVFKTPETEVSPWCLAGLFVEKNIPGSHLSPAQKEPFVLINAVFLFPTAACKPEGLKIPDSPSLGLSSPAEQKVTRKGVCNRLVYNHSVEGVLWQISCISLVLKMTVLAATVWIGRKQCWGQQALHCYSAP